MSTQLSKKEQEDLFNIIKKDIEYGEDTHRCAVCTYCTFTGASGESKYTCGLNKSIEMPVEADGSCRYWEHKAQVTAGTGKEIEEPLGGIPIVDLTKKIEPQQLNS